MELEAEEQNETPIIKLWKEVGAELAVKLPPPPLLSFLPSTNIHGLPPLYHVLC